MRFKEFNKKFFSTLNNRIEIKFLNYYLQKLIFNV